MGTWVVLQLVVIVITILILLFINRGKSDSEKQAGIAYVLMTLVLNVGYLFELMADDQSNLHMSLELQCTALIFMGYFLCQFFSYYIMDRVSQKLEVYFMAYDLLMLLVAWTNRWHDMIFKNVRFELSEHGYRISYGHGELFWFVVIGCVLFPAALSIVLVLSYIGRETVVRLRGQILSVSALLFGSFLMGSLFWTGTVPLGYNFAAPACALLADFFAIWMWGKEGFHPATASVETAFSSLDEGIIILDDAMMLMSYNDAAKRIFPELEPELVYHNIKRLRSIPLELFDDDYEKKEIEIGSRRYRVARSKVLDGRNITRGYVIVISDQTLEYHFIAEITNGRKKAEMAEQEAVHALNEAKRAERAKSDFLTNISHEIRTPMNAIVGLSELIMEESRGRKVYDFACDIRNASANLLAVINDIVSLSKLETGQMTLEREEYGTEQLLEETLHLAKMAASSRGLQLKRDISPKLPCRLEGDEGRVRQMITGFLNFGMKNTERGYVKLSVSHKWLNETQILLVFQFEDTGKGYTPEEAEHLFDQFESVDGGKEGLESIGLGIAITKRFVDLMDGTVTVSSEPGKGTVFTVCFPQKVADVRTIEQQPWHKLDVSEEFDRAFIVPGYRVLVVDDNRINLKVAVGALAPYQFRVDEAKSGRQAIEMVRENAYDMIFMDHMMPEMDGIEATAHIREECGENGKKPIIIALSANAYNNAREMFVSNGFQDFIAKPLDKDELHAKLRQWIPENLRLPAEGGDEAQEKMQHAQEAQLYMAGVDTKKALELHSGGIDDYLELLELYYMDGEEKTALLGRLVQEEDFKNYEIEVHGLKSASANIGAMEFSEFAKKHEFAAKDGDYELIREELPKLLSEYSFLLHEIERVLTQAGRLKPDDAGEGPQGEAMPEEEARARLAEILDDIENFRSKPAAAKVDALLSENIEKSVKDCLKEVRNRLKMYDDDAAEDLLRQFLDK